jgi:hypothetical protein
VVCAREELYSHDLDTRCLLQLATPESHLKQCSYWSILTSLQEDRVLRNLKDHDFEAGLEAMDSIVRH